MMSRITMDDGLISMISKMSEGNPGSVVAMASLVRDEGDIDPDSVWSKLGIINVLALDTYEIYGSSIYVLWNDKCRRNSRTMIMLLRATQLGYLPVGKLQELASDQLGEVNLTDEEYDLLDNKVSNFLTGFKKREDTSEPWR